jgi:cytochrome c-type biogenesis protein CcmH/NrfG
MTRAESSGPYMSFMREAHMARRPKRKSNASSTRPFAIIALIAIGLLVVGSIAAVFSSPSDSGDDDPFEDDAARITPGEEVARLETEIARNPDDAATIGLLAEVLANSGRVAESIPWYERAIELRPQEVPLRIAFARALQRNRSFFDAEVQFKRALDVDPEHQAAAFYLANLYEQMPDPRLADARVWYERAVEADPDSVIAGQARDRLTELGGSNASPSANP